MESIPYSQARVRRAAAHGMPESGAPEKYPKLLRKQKTRGSNAEGGNFLGSRLWEEVTNAD